MSVQDIAISSEGELCEGQYRLSGEAESKVLKSILLVLHKQQQSEPVDEFAQDLEMLFKHT